MRVQATTLLFCVCCGVAAPALAGEPDVYLITIDTLRADHVECYGYKHIKTPALNRLCRDGIRFSQAFTPSPITNSSHASILTGLYPSTHGVTDFGVPLSASHLTWAELLKGRGYHTAAFIGAVILDSKSLAPGFQHGFDSYDDFPAKAQIKSRWGRVERRGMDVVARAERWLRVQKTGPRFMWLHLYDPHDPYEPPPPYLQQYHDRLYDGEIAYSDHALGEFLTFLDTRGLYRNALIIVAGDHGEGLGEHQENTHGIFLYDTTTHVPLIAKLPGDGFAGKTVTAQVRTIDILPTVLDIVGVNTPAKFDGASLKPLWNGHASESRLAAGETDYPLRFGWAPLRSIRSDAHKFIEAPKPELYDIRADPDEKSNQYEPWNRDVQHFRAMLADLRKAAPVSAAGGAVPATTVDELRALGYLGPEGATNVPEPSLLPDPKDKIEVQNLLHHAMMAAEDGRPAQAQAALLQALRADPDSAATLMQLGQVELQQGQFRDAATHLQRARQLRPEDAAAAFYQGQALQRAGEYPAARAALEASLKLVPGQFEARRALGLVYSKLGQLKDAEDQLDAAVFLQPGNAAARIDYARVLLADRNAASATSQLEEATRLEPASTEAWELLKNAYDLQGKSALAAKATAHLHTLRRSR